ncbi:MAG TPA: transglycosylase domain-containing protein [Candidatus Acidoferrales bacterium]|nr:transglycosylase domain-containing protein [Candidatus Acidoferrales bacterium]
MPGPVQRARHRASRLVPFSGGLASVLLGLAAAVGVTAVAVIAAFAADLPSAQDLATIPVPQTTRIYDRTGEHLLYTLEDERRDLAPLASIPKQLQQATIAIEDRSFWSNPGIDVGGILRAATANARSGGISQGGSTITQQLIKTRLLSDEPTLTRKIKEALLAIEVTRAFSKDQILEMYLNQIYYGQQAYGVRAAAATYFGVGDLSQLTLGQIALLAGLPQQPSAYDPTQNPDAARARRSAVLDAMVDMDVITPEAADAADAEPIVVKPASTAIAAPHFVFRVREQLVNELGQKAAYQGGFTVLTTLDWNMQQLAEKEVKDHVDGLKANNVNNAALVTMDPSTGEVLAYVGSYDYYGHTPTMQGDYDHAGIAYRQPGSTFKLFTYLAGMQKLGLTASSRLFDIEWTQDAGTSSQYHPRDATLQQHGPVTLRQSLRESLNLPALQVTRAVGVDSIIDMVHQLGIQRDWDREKLGLAFGIGAGEMRLTDMASAYQVIANMGVRIEPTMILRITDHDGKVVRDFSRPEGRRVIDQRLAWIMTDILKDNTDPNGSFVFGPWTNIGRPAALKTGTTDSLQDVLAIGFTPTRLTAIWMGNSDNTEMTGISSALGPGVLWRDYMKTVVGGLPPDWYPRPAGIVDRVVCVNPSLYGGNGSGELPGPNCPASFRMTEHYVDGTQPTTDDRAFYTSCGIKLVAPFADWQKDYDRWAASAAAGGQSYGRYSWTLCGFAKQSASPSPTVPPTQPAITPRPTPTPRKRK